MLRRCLIGAVQATCLGSALKVPSLFDPLLIFLFGLLVLELRQAISWGKSTWKLNIRRFGHWASIFAPRNRLGFFFVFTFLKRATVHQQCVRVALMSCMCLRSALVVHVP